MPSGSRPIGNFYVQLGLNTQTFRRNLAEAQRDLRNAFGTAAIHASEVLAASIGAIGVALAGLSVKAVQLSADLDKQRIALTKLLGSAEAATDKIKELQEFSAKTGFSFSNLVDYQKRLMAVGFTAEETKFMLYQIADATAIIGNDADKLSRLIKAFGDIKAKGVLQTQEMKQLTELQIPAWDLLGKSIGKTREELTKLVEGRKISAETALWGITSGIQRNWGGMAEEISKTLSGAFNRLKSNIEVMITKIGKWLEVNLPLTDFFNAISEAIINTANTIKSSGLMGAFDTFAEKFPNITKSLQIIGETIVLLLIPGMASLAMYMAMMTVPLLKLVAAGLFIVEVMPRVISSIIDGFDFVGSIFSEFWLSAKKNVLSWFKWFLDKVHELEVSLRMIAYDIGEQVAVTGDNVINGLIRGLSYVTNWILRTIKKTMLAVHEIIESTFKSFDMYLQAIMPQNAYEGIKELLDKSKAQIKKFKDDEGTPAEQNVFRKIMGYKTTDDERRTAREKELAFWQQSNKTQDGLNKTIEETSRQLKSQEIISDEAFNNLVSGITDAGKDIGSFFGNLKSEVKTLWESLINPVKDAKNALENPWKIGENPVGGGEAKTNIPSVKTKEAKEKQLKENFGYIGIEAGNPLAGLTGYGFVYGKALSDEFAKLVKAHEESEKLRKSIFDLRVEIANGFTDAFTTAMTASGNFFHNLGEGFKKLGDQILKQIAQMLIFSTILRVLGINYSVSGFNVNPIFKEKALPTAGHTDDGIVSDGKIITTHPDDYIIATKDPSSLGGKPNVVVNVNNNSSSEVSTNSYFDGTREIIDIVINGISRNVSGSKDFFRSL